MKTLICLTLLLGIWSLGPEVTHFTPQAQPASIAPPITVSDSIDLQIAAGSKLYNKTLQCGACHGYHMERAQEGVPLLGKMNLRYGDQAKTVFRKTLDEGRPERGMPKWNFLTEKQKAELETYIFNLQNE